ncbi:hypothetical protein [Bacillus sp. JJ1562]|uniref:hypothetical protein n=1 Tax=Bacillus sp. JJ1562 TaxID=3122960 RepID=UPI0030031F42
MDKHVDELISIIRKLKSTISKESCKKLDLNKCERVVQRLASFSDSCAECQQYLLDLRDYFIQLEANIDGIETDLKQHKKIIHDIVSHLQKEHKLVPEGMYLTLFMSIGVSLGIVFGLTIFDNIGLGLPIGMSMGIAIGAGLDADAKKKGNTI